MFKQAQHHRRIVIHLLPHLCLQPHHVLHKNSLSYVLLQLYFNPGSSISNTASLQQNMSKASHRLKQLEPCDSIHLLAVAQDCYSGKRHVWGLPSPYFGSAIHVACNHDVSGRCRYCPAIPHAG